MRFIKVITLFALISILYAEAQTAEQTAATQCMAFQSQRNVKDIYPDPSDCHNFIKCFYLNETLAIGFSRQCPEGTFWHDAVTSCLPEGSTPCVDRCLEEATETRGCYAGQGCRQYFVCANTGSYGMCCPIGTSFNEATCSCDDAPTCADVCQQQAPPVATTVAPAQNFNNTVCIDSFGAFISTDTEPNAYHLIDEEGQSTGKQYCVEGFSFNIITCRCDIESDATVPPRQGLRRPALYIPFDTDTEDKSILGFSTFAFDGAMYSTDSAAVGDGSLAVNGGRIEIPGFKALDSRSSASWCAHFLCEGTKCQQGGVLANGVDGSGSGATAVMGFSKNATLEGHIYLVGPTDSIHLAASSSDLQPNQWHQACLTYNGNIAILYINGVRNILY